MRSLTLALTTFATALTVAAPAMAADYSDDIHKNDYKFLQFNYMYALKEKPMAEHAKHDGHDYLEMEFGGRSGFIDLYGYVDVFNLATNDHSDKATTSDKMFMKFAPRFSIDGMTGKDLSIGPFNEFYVSTLYNWGGDNGGVNNSFWGLGTDVMVPWLGKMGLNVYGLYDINQKDWNGYQVSTNWFKPFYTFANGSFLSYQGYIDYQFGMRESMGASSSNGGVMFNGLYWHTNHFAVGYGLKAYKDVYGIKDDYIPTPEGNLESTGVAHYFSVTYKF